MTTPPKERVPAKRWKHNTGFFDLPAELRNQIYDDMLAPRVREHDVGCPLICQITDMLPLWSATTLCHKFHHEIQSRQKLGVQLVLADTSKFDPWNQVPRLPEAALRVRSVDVHLCGVDGHYPWISSVLSRFQSLQSLRITASFRAVRRTDITPRYAGWGQFWGLRTPQGPWTSLACLESFEVLIYCPLTEFIAGAWDTGLEPDNVFSWDRSQARWISSSQMSIPHVRPVSGTL